MYCQIHCLSLGDNPCPVCLENAKIRGFIDALREEEGACITIPCDNPEFSENEDDNCWVEVIAGWTDWKPVRFQGSKLLVCLAKAHQEKQERTDKT